MSSRWVNLYSSAGRIVHVILSKTEKEREFNEGEKVACDQPSPVEVSLHAQSIGLRGHKQALRLLLRQVAIVLHGWKWNCVLERKSNFSSTKTPNC